MCKIIRPFLLQLIMKIDIVLYFDYEEFEFYFGRKLVTFYM
jgi:hypothetical protein